jgi:hypothetical protein
VTPERIAELRVHLERYAEIQGHRRAELAAALVRSLPEALDEIERLLASLSAADEDDPLREEIARLRAEAAHHAEAMRNGGVSLAWAEEQKRIAAGLEAQLQQAHEVCRQQAAEIATLREATRRYHIPCDDTGCSSDLCGAFR